MPRPEATPARPTQAVASSGRFWPRRLIWVGLALMLGAVAIVVWQSPDLSALAKPHTSRWKLADIPFDGAQAFAHLEALCAIGPRPSGSPGMLQQQALLTEHFESLGAVVERQDFKARHPQTGGAVTLTNLVLVWHPDRQERVLLAAHYDTRPFPDLDSRRPRGRFVGANDGASGVAVLMELGRHLPELEGRFGVDFVLFDAEELVYTEDDPYFLGSEHFARTYVRQPPPHRYRWGILLDMVGDADLQLYQERTSLSWRDTRPLVESLWQTAKRLSVREFIARPNHTVRDDHLALHDIAGIPTCDVIDFDYGPKRNAYWHTEQDTPDKCSGLSLAKVGWVLLEWLKERMKVEG